VDICVAQPPAPRAQPPSSIGEPPDEGDGQVTEGERLAPGSTVITVEDCGVWYAFDEDIQSKGNNYRPAAGSRTQSVSSTRTFPLSVTVAIVPLGTSDVDPGSSRTAGPSIVRPGESAVRS